MEDLKQKLRGKIACLTYSRTGWKNENIIKNVSDREMNDYGELKLNNFNPQTKIDATDDNYGKRKFKKLLKEAKDEGYNKPL